MNTFFFKNDEKFPPNLHYDWDFRKCENITHNLTLSKMKKQLVNNSVSKLIPKKWLMLTILENIPVRISSVIYQISTHFSFNLITKLNDDNNETFMVINFLH